MKNKENEITKIVKMLRDSYNTLNLSRVQTAEAFNMSTATLDRMRSRGLGPKYMKTQTSSKSNNGKVFYPIHSVAEYMVASQIECT